MNYFLLAWQMESQRLFSVEKPATAACLPIVAPRCEKVSVEAHIGCNFQGEIMVCVESRFSQVNSPDEGKAVAYMWRHEMTTSSRTCQHMKSRYHACLTSAEDTNPEEPMLQLPTKGRDSTNSPIVNVSINALVAPTNKSREKCGTRRTRIRINKGTEDTSIADSVKDP